MLMVLMVLLVLLVLLFFVDVADAGVVGVVGPPGIVDVGSVVDRLCPARCFQLFILMRRTRLLMMQ